MIIILLILESGGRRGRRRHSLEPAGPEGFASVIFIRLLLVYYCIITHARRNLQNGGCPEKLKLGRLSVFGRLILENFRDAEGGRAKLSLTRSLATGTPAI